MRLAGAPKWPGWAGLACVWTAPAVGWGPGETNTEGGLGSESRVHLTPGLARRTRGLRGSGLQFTPHGPRARAPAFRTQRATPSASPTPRPGTWMEPHHPCPRACSLPAPIMGLLSCHSHMSHFP